MMLGVIRLPKPKLISDMQQIVLESPRHIANAMLPAVIRSFVIMF
jgi:hypothetical protein